MKKFALLSLVSLFMVGCSENIVSDEPIQNGIQQETGEVQRSFLSIQLVAPSSINTRAEDYKDGSVEENKVNAVRFYFFDGDGKPANAYYQSGSDKYLSYIDWEPTSADESKGSTGTVEKIINATLGINIPKGGSLPAKVVAILNPTNAILGIENPSLDDLRKNVSDYYTNLHGSTDGTNGNNFLITNSVYADTDTDTDKKQAIYATAIKDDCYQPTVEEADKNKLNIYVERVLARLDLAITIPEKDQTGNNGATTSSANYIKIGEDYIYKVGSYQKVGENQSEDIYVKFLGWNITSTPSKSYLIKEINPEWSTKLFDTNEIILWNADNFKRSFWAVNPSLTDGDYWYGAFNPDTEVKKIANNQTPAQANKMPVPGSTSTAYMHENASDDYTNGYNPSNTSKVILAGQLVNDKGEKIPLIRWANRYYTEKGMLTAAANALNLYSVKVENDETKYTKIEPNQLKFVSAKEQYKNGTLPDGVHNYYVYLQLNDKAENGEKPATELVWANGNAKDTKPYDDIADVNKEIQNRINYLMYWNEGYTYYYFDIRHLGNNEPKVDNAGNLTKTSGYYGVVRNHIYQANIKSIAGLGTPVFNPDEIIYPETTDNDDHVLSADIRILQWRIVSQDYDIQW